MGTVTGTESELIDQISRNKSSTELQSEMPRPIQIRPRMYVWRSNMYENAIFYSPDEYSSVAR